MGTYSPVHRSRGILLRSGRRGRERRGETVGGEITREARILEDGEPLVTESGERRYTEGT